MKREVSIALFLLILIAPIAIVAQSASELRLVLNGGSPLPCKTSNPEEKDLHCHRWRMVFQNKGTEPIILINPTLGYGTGIKEIIYYYRRYDPETRTYVSDKEGARMPIDPDPAKVENFTAMAQLFEGDRPPENMTVTLKPNESFVFEESFEVRGEDKLLKRAVITQRDAATGKERQIISRDYPGAIRLTYEFSFLTYVSDPELLENLSRRWKRFGRLPLGQNGTYTITSEPIK